MVRKCTQGICTVIHLVWGLQEIIARNRLEHVCLFSGCACIQSVRAWNEDFESKYHRVDVYRPIFCESLYVSVHKLPSLKGLWTNFHCKFIKKTIWRNRNKKEMYIQWYFEMNSYQKNYHSLQQIDDKDTEWILILFKIFKNKTNLWMKLNRYRSDKFENII